MKNAAEYMNEMIARAKRMKSFKIVKLKPESFIFSGRVPMDLSIKDDLMTFTVYAVDLAEANAMVDKYLDDNSATEW